MSVTSGAHTIATSTRYGMDLDVLHPAELIKKCEELYTSFNPGTVTPDCHAEETIKSWKVQNSDDVTFLKQVFYGLYRYKKLINIFTSAFYHHNSGTVLRSDIHMYSVFTYLTILRLRELTFYPYRRLVLSQDPQKMLVFLGYIFNGDTLNKYCRDEWLKLYDKQFTDQLIEGILLWMPDVEELIGKLEEKVFLSKKKEEEEASAWAAGGKSQVTKVVPFKITQQKPRVQHQDPEPPAPYVAKPAPPVKEGPTVEMKKIAESKHRNKKELIAKYSGPGPNLATQNRPSNFDQVKEELEAQRAAELRFDDFKATPAPVPATAQVKLNAATILREDALYKKKQEEESKIIAAYEAELRDASTFKQWQSEMRSKDERERAEEIERRRIEMKEAQEAAIQARADQVEANREMANDMKSLGKQLEEAKAAEKKAQVEENRKARDEIVEARSGIGVAHEKMAMEKKQRAEELVAEKQENARRLAEEKALEQQRKQDIIRQLKAMESVPMTKLDEFDPTSTPGHGLLEEMSLLELKERLAVEKRRAKQEEDEKREDILNAKQKREDLLKYKAGNISRIRDLANQQAVARRTKATETKQNNELKANAKREKDMLDLHDRLQKKHEAHKAEQIRLAAEEKAIKFEQQRQAATKGQVEEIKFKGLRKGQERDLKKDQHTVQTNAALYEKTKSRAESIRRTNVNNNAKEKRDFIKEYDRRVEMLTQMDLQSKADDLDRKKNIISVEQGRVDTMMAGGLHMTARAVTSQHDGGMVNPDGTLARERYTSKRGTGSLEATRNVVSQ